MQKQINILVAEKQFDATALALLRQKAKVTVATSGPTFLRALRSADAMITGIDVRCDAALLKRAVRLRVIGSRTTQLRYIDLAYCEANGITVLHIKPDSKVLQQTSSTAEEAFALILALTRNIPWAFDQIKERVWDRRKYAGIELKGKILGIIGYGRLGRMVAQYGRAFGMRVIAHDPQVAHRVMRADHVTRVSLNAVLSQSDIVSLHATFNDANIGMLQGKHFSAMKRSAYFINTARGELTNERALLAALRARRIAGAGIDTLAGEDPQGAHLQRNGLVEYARTHENLIILPHLGGATVEATARTQQYISSLVIAFLKKNRPHSTSRDGIHG